MTQKPCIRKTPHLLFVLFYAFSCFFVHFTKKVIKKKSTKKLCPLVFLVPFQVSQKNTCILTKVQPKDVIHHCLSSTVIHCHPSSDVVDLCPQSLSIVIHRCPLSSIVDVGGRRPSPSFIGVGGHRPSRSVVAMHHR